MHIVEVTHRFPPQIGGVEHHVHELSKRLANEHQITVLSADGNCRETIDGIHVVRHPSSFYRFSPSLLKTLDDLDYDKLHVHNYHSLPATTASLLEKADVFTPHYHGRGSTAFSNVLLSIYKLVGSKALENSRKIIAVSEWEQAKLVQDFDAKNLSVVRHGLDYDRFDVQQNDTKPYILSVGRLVDYKNIDRAIDAADNVGINMVIAGDGSEKEQLMAYAKTKDISCNFLGFVPDSYLPKLYANAAVTINLSSFEAFGMTVAESLAAGTPVVCAPNQGLLDWTGTEGVVFASRSNVEKSIRIAQDARPDRRPLPTWDEVTKQTEALLC